MECVLTGVSTGTHPLLFYRKTLQQRGILSSSDLIRCASRERVQTAGLLVVHQSPPTAKGFHFLTLEDDFGFINVIIRPKVYIQFQHFIRSEVLLLVRGEVQRQGEVTNVLAQRVETLVRDY